MATYYVTTTGAGAHNGADEANAWTLAEATAGVAADDLIYVKAGTYTAQDGTSNAVMNLQTAGTASTWIQWEAYTTTAGDWDVTQGPIVILDANTNTLANAMTGANIAASLYNKFSGFRFTGGSAEGVNGSTTCNWLSLYGCRVDNNDTTGIQFNDNLDLVACEVDNNTTRAVDADNSCRFTGSVIHSNGNTGAVINVASPPTIAYCLFYNNGNGTIMRATAGGGTYINNTFDGESGASSYALSHSGSSSVMGHVFGNIFANCAIGVNFETAGAEAISSYDYNTFYNCTTRYDTVSDAANDVIAGSSPFTSIGTDDYSIVSGSAALDVMLDASHVIGWP